MRRLVPSLNRAVVAAAALVAVATAGCGLGPGESSQGTASLTVTRDYGSEKIADATVTNPSASETVLRALDSNVEITTRYGGGFVQSIDGIEGSSEAGRVRDWFFFVNGIESSTGSADVPVAAGDRIWWDYRDWTDAMRAPAVVGSWPEPFAQDPRVEVVCFGAGDPCQEARRRLADAGVQATVVSPRERAENVVSMLVGPWDQVRSDSLADELQDGPETSGVFARFEPSGDDWTLSALNERADPQSVNATGLVAAMRDGEHPPTWVVTGTTAAGVTAAVAALNSDDLRDHYDVVVDGENVTALPVR